MSKFTHRLFSTGRCWRAIFALPLLLLSAPLAHAASLNSSPITYYANPPHQFAFSTSSMGQSFPSPAQCEKTYGLACYTPAEIRKAYNIPSSYTGTGQTIAIVDAYGSPTVQSDLHVFDTEFGLPDPTLNVIYPSGQPAFNVNNGNEVGWAEETSLDVQWSHAIAPNATIDLVVAPSNDGNALNNAEQYVVNTLKPDVMSMSFGSPEAAIKGGGNNIQLQQSEAIYQAAKQENITVIAAAGDWGASNSTFGYTTPNALYPASSPNVLGVGGTDLFTGGTGAYKSETVWNDSIPSLCPFGCDYGVFGATGGAPSSIFSAPAYQQGVTGFNMRTTSDVAYNASVYTAVMVYLGFLGSSNDGFYFFGGTSEGAPQWAGIVALADQAAGTQLGFLNPSLYAIGANALEYGNDFHDVTVGNNDLNGTPGFNAGTGYDLPTGLGSPNAANLITTLAGK